MTEHPNAGFLAEPAPTPATQKLFDDDLAGDGYVANLSRLWAQDPEMLNSIAGLMGQATDAAALTFRQRAVLVTAAVSTLGDSYCSLAWGKKLAGASDDPVTGGAVAAGVITGDDDGLDPAERVVARWARQIATDPNATTAADIDNLRAAGFDDKQIFAITAYIALRLCFSTINDALGVRPDLELGEIVPTPVRDAVTYGRPVGTEKG